MFVGATQQVKNRVVGAPRYMASNTERLGFIANSFTQNYGGDGGLGAFMQYVLNIEQPTNTTDLNPVAAGPNTTGDPSGWFFAQGLSGMCFGGNGTTTTDGLDHVYANGVGTYDSLVFTSGYRQDGDSTTPPVSREDIGLGTSSLFSAYLEWKRLIVQDLNANGYTGSIIFRITQEGENWNRDANYDDATRITQVLVLAAQQLESEVGSADVPLQIYNIPDQYMRYRLSVGNLDGISGQNGPQDPVPSAQTLTHQASLQPGNLYVGWLNRSQNNDPPTNNGHQNLMGMLCSAALWLYALYDIDPAVSMGHFALPFTLPTTGPADTTENMINTDGSLIYLGQRAGLGIDPFDPVAPYNLNAATAGVPDQDAVMPWTATLRTEIADRIRGSYDDWLARTTGFEL